MAPVQPKIIGILDDIKSGLEGIAKPANPGDQSPYLTTVSLVDVQFKVPSELSDAQFPAILIVPSTINFAETTSHYNEPVTPLYLFGYVKSNTEPVYEMLRLAKDVLRWLRANSTLGGKCDNMSVQRLELSANVFSVFGMGNGFVPPYAAFRMDVELSFTFDMDEGG